MARAFSSSTHNLRTSGGALAYAPTFDGTISIWINPAWNAGDSAQHVFWQYNTSGTSSFISFQKFSDNKIYVGQFLSTVDIRISVNDTALFSSGVWANWIYDWSDAANTQTIYRNNSSVGSRSTTFSTAVTAHNEFTLGNQGSAFTQVNCNSRLAEYGEWNVVLTAGERAALAAGVSPLLVRPSNLKRYRPLSGFVTPENDWVAGDALTVTSAASYPHPRVIMPRRRRMNVASVVVPPTFKSAWAVNANSIMQPGNGTT